MCRQTALPVHYDLNAWQRRGKCWAHLHHVGKTMALMSTSSDAAYNRPLNPMWLQTETKTGQTCRARPSVQLKMC